MRTRTADAEVICPDNIPSCPWCDATGLVVVRDRLYSVRCANSSCPVGPETKPTPRLFWAIRRWSKRAPLEARAA